MEPTGAPSAPAIPATVAAFGEGCWSLNRDRKEWRSDVAGKRRDHPRPLPGGRRTRPGSLPRGGPSRGRNPRTGFAPVRRRIPWPGWLETACRRLDADLGSSAAREGRKLDATFIDACDHVVARWRLKARAPDGDET